VAGVDLGGRGDSPVCAGDYLVGEVDQSASSRLWQRDHSISSDLAAGGPGDAFVARHPLLDRDLGLALGSHSDNAQLFGALENQLSNGAIPVIVEGPIDAVAVTLASRGAYIGVAPLGTSLTDEQAHQLARIGTQPIVATDADLAGRIAAERDFWMLSCYGLDPLQARLPDGTDPADLLALRGPAALTEALATAQPLAEQLLDERLANLPPGDALLEATRVIAARPSHHWDQDSSAISSQLGVPTVQVRHALRTFVNVWNTDPRQAARQPLQALGDVKRRISRTIELATQHRRTALPRHLDQRRQPDPHQAGDTYRTPKAKRTPQPSRAGISRTRTR
jgi:DNA primase